MLRLFGPDCPTKPVDPATLGELPPEVIWVDLLNPTHEEEKLAEKLVGTNIPTRDELLEIEPSSRLYEKGKRAYMTMSVLYGMNENRAGNDPIGFILTDNHLVTVRYVDPKPFIIFAEHLYADPELAGDAKGMLVRLLDAVIDRLADEFEVLGHEIDGISKRIFKQHTHRKGTAPELRLEALLMRIGKAQRTLALLREGALSGLRLLTFLPTTAALEDEHFHRRHIKSLVADAQALADHSNFLGDNLTFLLDASLGLISLEQNNVMKLFSVFAVVFMPPTLIAGIYGMNFEHMPELKWVDGYPLAVLAMLLSAILPYFWAKRKGWL